MKSLDQISEVDQVILDAFQGLANRPQFLYFSHLGLLGLVWYDSHVLENLEQDIGEGFDPCRRHGIVLHLALLELQE